VCHIAKRKIQPGESWQLDHVVALINGGEHRESNLVPVLTDKHKEKTKSDVAEKSRMYYKRAKAIGVKKKRRTIPGKRFDGTPIPSKWKH
jgi:5-methylcytosine-specific restriction endonuclease McrA